MSKRKPLTVTLHIGGKQVDKLTDDQCECLAQRVGEAMSLYYTAHPEEYIKLSPTYDTLTPEKE